MMFHVDSESVHVLFLKICHVSSCVLKEFHVVFVLGRHLLALCRHDLVSGNTGDTDIKLTQESQAFGFFFSAAESTKRSPGDLRWFFYKVGPYDRYKWSYGAPINGLIYRQLGL